MQSATPTDTRPLLFQHSDGRQAVTSLAEAERLTSADPSWYRAGPVDIVRLGQEEPGRPMLDIKHLPALPDADTDVIVFFAAGGSTLGAWDGERWIDCTGMPLDQEDPSGYSKVTAWAEFPSLEGK